MEWMWINSVKVQAKFGELFIKGFCYIWHRHICLHVFIGLLAYLYHSFYDSIDLWVSHLYIYMKVCHDPCFIDLATYSLFVGEGKEVDQSLNSIFFTIDLSLFTFIRGVNGRTLTVIGFKWWYRGTVDTYIKCFEDPMHWNLPDAMPLCPTLVNKASYLFHIAWYVYMVYIYNTWYYPCENVTAGQTQVLGCYEFTLISIYGIDFCIERGSRSLKGNLFFKHLDGWKSSKWTNDFAC